MPFWRPKFLKCQYFKPVSLFPCFCSKKADYLQDRTCHRFYSPCSRLSTALLRLLWGESNMMSKGTYKKIQNGHVCINLKHTSPELISFQFPTSCGHPLSKYHEFPLYLVLHLIKGSAACKKRVGIEMHAALQRGLAERSYCRDMWHIYNRRQ